MEWDFYSRTVFAARTSGCEKYLSSDKRKFYKKPMVRSGAQNGKDCLLRGDGCFFMQ